MSEVRGGPGMGYGVAGDDRIYFVEAGTGCPLLLLRGAFGSGQNILGTDLGKAQAVGQRFIAPASLGHGRSDAPSDRLTTVRTGTRAGSPSLSVSQDAR